MTDIKKADSKDLIYNYQDTPDGFHVVFSDSLSMIDRICRETKKFMETQSLAKKLIFDIELGIREALSNAIRHGTATINNATIQYRLIYDIKGIITITVTDSGPGFDWEIAMQRTLPSLDESGRGIFIMQNYFDTIQFNKKGNEVTLLKMVHREKIVND